MKRSILIALALLAVLAAVPALAQQNPSNTHSFAVTSTTTAPSAPSVQIVGKQGWVTLKSDTKFGDAVLKPGTYYVEHEMSGLSHVFTFQQVGDPDLALQYSDESLIGRPVSVPCNLETLPARVKHTKLITVPDGTLTRVVEIEIKGENVAHTFQR